MTAADHMNGSTCQETSSVATVTQPHGPLMLSITDPTKTPDGQAVSTSIPEDWIRSAEIPFECSGVVTAIPIVLVYVQYATEYVHNWDGIPTSLLSAPAWSTGEAVVEKTMAMPNPETELVKIAQQTTTTNFPIRATQLPVTQGGLGSGQTTDASPASTPASTIKPAPPKLGLDHPTTTMIDGVSVVISDSRIIIASQTLTPGSAISFLGNQISLAPSSTALIVGSSTIQLDPATTPPPMVLTIKGLTITADSASAFVVDGKTLTPGGSVTIDGTVVSLGSSVAVIDASTQTLGQGSLEPTVAPSNSALENTNSDTPKESSPSRPPTESSSGNPVPGRAVKLGSLKSHMMIMLFVLTPWVCIDII